MNCKQAEIAMMEHFEKTIQPARAKSLAQHVLKCEDCREYYVGLDMALEVLDEPELNLAPADFTQNVMAKVSELPAYTKPIGIPLRIVWGLGVIFLGIGLLFAFNPQWLTAMTEASPVLYSILTAMYAARTAVTDAIANAVASTSYQGTETILLNVTIVFVVIVGALLAVLQRSEKSSKA